MATMYVMEPPTSQVAILHRISNIVSSELSLDEMLGEIVGLTAQVTECDACLVYLIDLQSGEMVLRASQVPHAADLGNIRMKMGEGVTGWVAEHKSVVALSKNAAADHRFKRFRALVEDTYEAFLSAPVIARNRVVGVVNVQHRVPHQHTGSEMEVLTTVGEQVGCVLVLARMEPTAVAEVNQTGLSTLGVSRTQYAQTFQFPVQIGGSAQTARALSTT